MQGTVAITKLRELLEEARRDGIKLKASQKFSSWRARTQTILTRALGADHHITTSFINGQFASRIAVARLSDAPTIASQDDPAFARGLAKAQGLIEAAIFDLELAGSADETAFDADLWAHIAPYIQNEDWHALATQTAVFVEDRIRTWTRNPPSKGGGKLVGKGLYNTVFANDGAYRLGTEAGEWEGWRALGSGFAQALGNVDRHNVQRRADVKRYAFGVLGLGSLLLTQLRYQHGDHLK
jgi:hypothetical protein